MLHLYYHNLIHVVGIAWFACTDILAHWVTFLCISLANAPVTFVNKLMFLQSNKLLHKISPLCQRYALLSLLYVCIPCIILLYHLTNSLSLAPWLCSLRLPCIVNGVSLHTLAVRQSILLWLWLFVLGMLLCTIVWQLLICAPCINLGQCALNLFMSSWKSSGFRCSYTHTSIIWYNLGTVRPGLSVHVWAIS